ncbi:MAG: M56 family metallopeptidase [Bacteroidales bacterium]|nr:M56 family metallopeptidase [Bacteroidales bacterium]
MVKFLLYLFESGLCLSILLLVYIFFFRKETYFRFNRIYLISIMFFSLTIPIVHVSFNVSNTQKYESPFKEIGKFRSYYEQLIAMTDPEYLYAQNNQDNSGFEEFDYDNYSNTLKSEENIKNSAIETRHELQSTKNIRISIAQLLLITYIIGVIIFLSRILILFKWIYKTISNNFVEYQNDVKLIKVNDNLPPFSFLGYVFLNRDIVSSNQSDQVLAHEKAHIIQKHSADLLLAHFLTIFQWFNPLAWILQKAIKTNHEYIADSEVVRKGYNLFDYQELLLNQFISIPSVQLVNNFNLISIKKRIAMMNKIKSGFKAKLKAFLIIPFAIITFLMFANLTVNGPRKVLKNFSFFESQNSINQVKGLWKNETKDTYGYLIKFSEDKFSILENQVKLKEYDYKIKDNNIVLNVPNGEPIALKFQITNNKIKIWWNDLNSSEFTKTSFENSLDVFLAEKNLNITPPTVKNYKKLEKLELCLFVSIHENKVIVQNQTGEFADLEKLILEEKSKFNQLDLNIITVQLAVDENTPMKQVYDFYQILRKINLLKIAFVCYPDDNTTNLYPPTAFTRKLPPMDAEEVEIEDLPAMSIKYFEIDATNIENTPETIKPNLTKFISESEKYIKCLVFNNSTTYKNYTEYNDMVWTVIFEFRNQYALEKYNIEYKSLGNELQKEVRKKYPIILSQHNSDEDTSKK